LSTPRDRKFEERASKLRIQGGAAAPINYTAKLPCDVEARSSITKTKVRNNVEYCV
jgi:hypothetical protein